MFESDEEEPKWLGHMDKMSGEIRTKRVSMSEVEGTKRREKSPRMRWEIERNML